MKILNANKLYIFFFACTIILFSIISLYISFTNRIEGDAAFHALVSREIAEDGRTISSTSYILANEKNNFPIAYPQIFHLIGAISFLYIGNNTFIILPVLYGVMSLYFLAIIFMNIHKNLAATLLGVLILALNIYFLDYSSKYFMEIGLVFTILAALAYTMKYVNKKNTSSLYIASIFFGLSVAIKQQGLIALPIFLIILFLSYLWNKSFKQIIISILFFLLIAVGPMIQLFYSTGSILYAGDNPPKIIQIIEEPLRKVLRVKLLEGDKEWSTINQGRRDEEIVTWRDISNTVTAWTVQDDTASIPWVELTGILLLILIVRVIKTRSIIDLVMLVFLGLFYFLLYYLARPRYALPLIVLPSVTLFYIIHTLKIFKTKAILIVSITSLFIIYTMINFGSKLPDIMSRDDYGYFGVYNDKRNSQLQSLYDSIKIDNNINYTVLSPVPYETAFYTKHATIWANPYGATDLFKSFLSTDEKTTVAMLKKYRVKYLIIYNDRFMRYSNWVGISPSDAFFSKIATSKNFHLIKHNDSGRVYVANFQ